MRKFVADTVALLAYFVDALPKAADNIFRDAENGNCILLIPDICIGEFIYVVLKQKHVFSESLGLESIDMLLDMIESTDNVICASLTLKSWRSVPTINIPELHDRIVVAVYFQEGAEAIITDDPEIASVARTIWTTFQGKYGF